MLDQRIIELINAGIDGELGPEEQRELDAVLDSSPEAVTFRLELLQLNNAFSNLPELDPPPALARTILDAPFLTRYSCRTGKSCSSFRVSSPVSLQLPADWHLQPAFYWRLVFMRPVPGS